jgi:hypothetical protein
LRAERLRVGAWPMRAQACELIVRRRRSQLEECEAQLAREAAKAYEMDAELQRHRQRPRAAMRAHANARVSVAQADVTLPRPPRTCSLHAHANSQASLTRARRAHTHTHRWAQQHTDLQEQNMWDKGRHKHLADWEREVNSGVGDADSTASLCKLLLAAAAKDKGKGAGKSRGGVIPSASGKRGKEFADKMWELRELVRLAAQCRAT